MNLENKIEQVKEILKGKKVAIAFSGGADSTLITYLASQVSKDILAITIDNNLFPTGFIEHCKDFCENLNVEHTIVFEDFYNHKDIISNKPNRCYLCRKEMYKYICQISKENGFDLIVDGTNLSDLVEDRPGILIKYDNNIQSPFVEARLTSKDIHDYLDINNINYSHSTTCLATRTPFNEEFTNEKYERISRSENFIYNKTNCKIVKIREKYPDCIVEVDNINEIVKKDTLKLIYDELKANGYEKVLLNLKEIEDNDTLNIDYNDGEFSYKLPYEIDIDKTKICDDNIKISENGLIIGRNFKDPKNAKEEFINILPKIRRKL